MFVLDDLLFISGEIHEYIMDIMIPQWNQKVPSNMHLKCLSRVNFFHRSNVHTC